MLGTHTRGNVDKCTNRFINQTILMLAEKFNFRKRFECQWPSWKPDWGPSGLIEWPETSGLTRVVKMICSSQRSQFTQRKEVLSEFRKKNSWSFRKIKACPPIDRFEQMACHSPMKKFNNEKLWWKYWNVYSSTMCFGSLVHWMRARKLERKASTNEWTIMTMRLGNCNYNSF